VDAFSQLLIFVGLGLSPFISFEVASLALIGYLLLTVYVYVNIYVTGVFKISYGKFGPTEIRAIAIILNVIFLISANPTIEFSFGTVSVYDIVALGIATVLIAIFIYSVSKRASELRKIGE
jgi:hypothetical protein